MYHQALTPILIFVLCLVAAHEVAAQKAPAALDFSMNAIDGKEVALSKYAGKVVVFVNTASKCGYTPQYKQLQQLHSDYADKGIAIVGIPCNQFGKQEPGTEKEIAAFCKKNYGVEFDMLAKVDVKGKNQCELYKHLTKLDLAPFGKGSVKWNFEKIVIDKTGKPIARFGSKVKPDSKEFMSVIDKAIGGNANSSGNQNPYSHVSKKTGKTYYLFMKEVPLKNSDKTSTIYWFAKEPTSEKGSPVSEVPKDKVVSETKTGMLVLKSNKKKK
jgi:glutathione peroxidase